MLDQVSRPPMSTAQRARPSTLTMEECDLIEIMEIDESTDQQKEGARQELDRRAALLNSEPSTDPEMPTLADDSDPGTSDGSLFHDSESESGGTSDESTTLPPIPVDPLGKHSETRCPASRPSSPRPRRQRRRQQKRWSQRRPSRRRRWSQRKQRRRPRATRPPRPLSESWPSP